MLGEAFEHLPAEVQSGKARIGRLQPGQNAQGMGVMIEAADVAHRLVERILAGMAEGRMADVMGEAQRLCQILVEAKRAGERPADLGDLQTVRQANADMIVVRRDEHLGLVAQSTKGDRVDNPVAIALKGIAWPGRAVAFAMEPATARRRIAGVGREAHGPCSLSTFSPAVLTKWKDDVPWAASLLMKSCAASLSANGPTSRRLVALSGTVDAVRPLSTDPAGPDFSLVQAFVRSAL